MIEKDGSKIAQTFASSDKNGDNEAALSPAEAALANLNEALSRLQRAIDGRMHFDEDQTAMQAELKRTSAERKHLAAKLDQAEARAKTVQQANKDIAKRLGATMEVIRSILENQSR